MPEWSISSRRQFLKVGAAGAAGAVLPSWATTRGAPAIVDGTERTAAGAAGPAVRRSGRRLGRRLEPQRSARAHARRVVLRRDVRTMRTASSVRTRSRRPTSRRDRTSSGLEPGSDVFVRVSFQSLEERSGDRASR